MKRDSGGGGEDGWFSGGVLSTGIISFITMLSLDYVYNKLANRLTKHENHKTE